MKADYPSWVGALRQQPVKASGSRKFPSLRRTVGRLKKVSWATSSWNPLRILQSLFLWTLFGAAKQMGKRAYCGAKLTKAFSTLSVAPMRSEQKLAQGVRTWPSQPCPVFFLGSGNKECTRKWHASPSWLSTQY